MPCEPARTTADREPGTSGTVLIVEDEVLIRFALADFLRANNFKVYEARDGEEAIQLLSFYRADIDVVFTDVRLPGGIDGFSLAQWVQRYKPGATVMIGSGFAVDLAAATIDDVTFFTKPYDLKAVRLALEAVSHQHRDRAE